jgi:hypothetical protein
LTVAPVPVKLEVRLPQSTPLNATDEKLLATVPLVFLTSEVAAAVLASSRAFKLNPGDQAAHSGRYPAELMIIVEGRLKRVWGGQTSADAAGELVGTYEPIALDCLIQNTPYPYSLHAEQNATICLIAWRDLKPLLDKVPGLLSYLSLTAKSPAIRELDLSLEDMGCSHQFRSALIGGLKLETLPPETWLAEAGTIPTGVCYGVSGTLQTYSKVADGTLKPLWIAPNASWQLWDSCLAQTSTDCGV